jgi:hypothetical protein
MSQISPPAKAEEVLKIVGPLDDSVLMRIVETEATWPRCSKHSPGQPPTIRSARNWNSGPRGGVTRVYEILKREEPEPDER